MKRTTRKLLVLALAMLLSGTASLTAFAMAQEIIGADGPVELGNVAVDGCEGQDTDAIGSEDLQVELAVDEAIEALDLDEDMVLDLDGGADLALDIDNGTLENAFAGEMEAVTEEAALAGEDWQNWQGWTRLPPNPGNYRIDHAVTMNGAWTAPEGTTKLMLTTSSAIVNTKGGSTDLIIVPKDATLEISGDRDYWLRADGITVQVNGTFKMSSCTIEGKGIVVAVGKGGTFIMDGGEVTAENPNDGAEAGVTVDGGSFTLSSGTISSCKTGVVVTGGGSFTMDGGTIKDNGKDIENSESGGVRVNDGTFSMDGGTITGNGNRKTSGGGVYIGSGIAFTMSYGTISNNTAAIGGGVYLADKASFTMANGTISDNKTMIDGGGGVCIGANGVFTMKNGTITGNHAYSIGSAVYIPQKGTFNLSGGVITKNDSSGGGSVNVRNGSAFNMSGGMIRDNDDRGVYLHERGTFNLSGGIIRDNSGCGVFCVGTFNLSGAVDIRRNKRNIVLEYPAVINIAGPLNNEKPIGVSCNRSIGENANGAAVITRGLKGNGDDANFKSEQGDGYDILVFPAGGKYPDGEAVLGIPATITFDAGSGKATGAMKPQVVARNIEWPLNANRFSLRGSEFKGWDCAGKTYKDKDSVTLTGDATLAATWDHAAVSVAPIDDVTYTGEEIEPALTIVDATGETLVPGKDYAVEYYINVDAGKAVAIVEFKGDYDWVGKMLLNFIINKANPAVTAPKAKTGLVEDGTAQALIVKGNVVGGTMQYSLDGENWDTDVPTATRAGDYTVYYRVVGDRNHNDVEAESVKATIAARQTPSPTATPTPTAMPTETPKPTVKPTATPKPTVIPVPTAKPTTIPTTTPTAKPTMRPTATPTAMPEPTAAPVAPDYTLLAQMTVSGKSKTALKIAWTKVKGADGYDVYFARCGKRFKLKKTVKASASRVVRLSGLDKRQSYKGYVRAWKKVNGKKTYIGAASPKVHAATGGYTNKVCNTKSVTLNKKSLTLKAGRSSRLKATLKGVKSGMKLLQHVQKVRWYSSNANVATVDAKGKVKAIAKGRCTIYAVANNGVRRSVKVKVN